MDVTHKIVLDFKRNAMPPILYMVQGDSGTRIIEAYLVSGGAVWNVPDDVICVVGYINADGSKGVYDTLPDGSAACTPAGNLLTVRLVPQVCAVPGITQVSISMIRAGMQLSTFRCRLYVEGDIAGGKYPGDYVNLETWLASNQTVGPPGRSAYEEDRAHGYTGTVEQWLRDLRGAVFTPKIQDGYLVWSNDKGLKNPPSIPIDGSAIEVAANLDKIGIWECSHTKNGITHELAVNHTNTGVANLKFTAAAPFADGDTIKLNGATMTAKTIDGEPLPGGAWVSGAVVMCFVSGGTLFFRGGGGSNKSQILVTAPSGCAVTAACGSIVKTAVEKAGQWIFRNCGVGEWTVKATHPDQPRPATKKVNITEEGQLMRYRVTLSFFAATIPVSYPAGAACTCSNGSTVLTAPDTSGNYTFAVPYAGDWTVKAVLGSDSDSKVISVTEARAYPVTLSFRDYLVENGLTEQTFTLSGLYRKQEEGYLVFYGDAGGLHEAYIKNVDLTGYKSLTIEGIFEPSNEGESGLAVWETSKVPNYDVAAALSLFVTGQNTVSVDVSALSGTYHVGITSIYKAKQKISNMYLS